MKRLMTFVLLLLVISLVGLLGLAACAGQGAGGPDPRIEMNNAEATQKAGAVILSITQEAARRAALDATRQAAQTAGAAQAEIDLIYARETQIWSAYAVAQAQTASAQDALNSQATRTQAAKDSVATATQSAVATLTAIPLTQAALDHQLSETKRQEAEAAQRAYWQSWIIPLQTLAYPLLVLVLCCLVLAGLIVAFIKVLPAIVIRMQAFRHGQRNELVVIFNLPDGRKVALLPERNFGPGAMIGPDGQVHQVGLAPTVDAQARITSQAQAADLAAAMLPGHPVPQISLPGAAAPQVELIEVPGPHVAGWVDEVDEKYLTSGGDR